MSAQNACIRKNITSLNETKKKKKREERTNLTSEPIVEMKQVENRERMERIVVGQK